MRNGLSLPLSTSLNTIKINRPRIGAMVYNILPGGGAELLVGAVLIVLTRCRKVAMGRPAMAVSIRRRRPYRMPKH